MLLLICLSTPLGAAAQQYTLERISGDGQRGAPGETLQPFVIEVRNQNGVPVPGVFVTFVPDDGSVSTAIIATDANGQAQTTLTLGSDPGTYTVTAYVRAVSVTFEVTASRPTLSIISGDGQVGAPGETLQPLVVEVRNLHGNPVPGAFVVFVPDGGLVSAIIDVTGGDGRAETTLTLGSSTGTYKVTAQVSGVSVTFEAVAALSPTTLEKISGDNQIGRTGRALARPFVVEVRDENGDPLGGITVTFALSAGGGSLSAETPTTDANGRAASKLTLGNDPGAVTVTVTVEGITGSLTFNAVAELFEFDLSLPAGLSLIHIPLKVRTVDGMPTTIQSVADLYGALGGASTVNLLITYDADTQAWNSYFGDRDRGSVADKALTDHTGIVAGMKVPISVRFAGDALGVNGLGVITLHQGPNLVGLPLDDRGSTV